MFIMVTVVCIYNHKINLIMILSNKFHNDPCKISANTLSLQDGVQLVLCHGYYDPDADVMTELEMIIGTCRG